MRSSTWIAIIGVVVVLTALLFITGKIVLTTKPAEDTNNSSKIVKIVESEPEYLVREAD